MTEASDPNALAISPPPSTIEVDQVIEDCSLISETANIRQHASSSDDDLYVTRYHSREQFSLT